MEPSGGSAELPGLSHMVACFLPATLMRRLELWRGLDKEARDTAGMLHHQSKFNLTGPRRAAP